MNREEMEDDKVSWLRHPAFLKPFMPTCKNCKGQGYVGKKRRSPCYYCLGKGVRSRTFGRDKQ